MIPGSMRSAPLAILLTETTCCPTLLSECHILEVKSRRFTVSFVAARGKKIFV
jgi:hypothetical protein